MPTPVAGAEISRLLTDPLVDDSDGPGQIEALLAEAPRIRDVARQTALTERFLAPALAGLEALFQALRAEVDASLQVQQPSVAGKPYPLGQCMRITTAVQRRLGAVDAAGLSPQAARGHRALTVFARAGGTIHRAWGDLRGEYFQNALLIGALYVDVANDTVVPTKPKVEIRPFAQAGFSPIADHRHYGRIAERYWGDRIFPNHLLPALAPYLPLIQLGPTGRVSLGPTTSYMLGLTLSGRFAPSEEALNAPPLPGALFGALAAALNGRGWTLPQDALEGRAEALAACERYRAEGRHHSMTSLGRALLAANKANGRLLALTIADGDGDAAAGRLAPWSRNGPTPIHRLSPSPT
ncbi:hypothetical protein LJR225_002562 [Phenylobacterium sp. LjRoot225]|uniref:hypothetical protein n=1 Tax=Phenylobacterium sp. LjRoot225 TaxID=3342285 RepID=UPI003ECFA0B2